MKVIRRISVLVLILTYVLSLKLNTKTFLNSKEDYDNEKVIVNANGQENPMIPVAAGIGGEGIS